MEKGDQNAQESDRTVDSAARPKKKGRYNHDKPADGKEKGVNIELMHAKTRSSVERE
jgi:hypothetical protein